MDNVEYSAVIKYLSLKGGAPLQIDQDLINNLGENVPSYSAVKHWVGDFKRGRESVEDEKRRGRPSTATIEENVVLALDMS